MPDIQLHVNGKVYGGWKEARVTRSLDAVSGKFDLSVTDRWEVDSQPWQIFPGDECIIKIDGATLITGYVDQASPEYDDGGHGIRISGRDKTCDLVDCSAVVKSYELRGLRLEEIAADLAQPFGIKVQAQASTGAKFDTFAIQPGETCWEAIERAARQRFMVVTTNGAGDLVIAGIGNTHAIDAIVEGKNIKRAAATYDYSERFSEYIVKGQAPAKNDGSEPPKNAVQSKATDPAITRYRPKVLTSETQATGGSAQDRAELEASARAGKSTKITVTVVGWKMSNGQLWQLNTLVNFDSPMLVADNVELLTSQLTFAISQSEGIVTEMTLVKPGTYLLGRDKGRKKKKGKKKGSKMPPIDWELEGY